MRLLTHKDVTHISGGSFSVHINTSIPLNYVPIVNKFLKESGETYNMETIDFAKLVEALNQAGLDPSKVQIDFDITYFTSFL